MHLNVTTLFFYRLKYFFILKIDILKKIKNNLIMNDYINIFYMVFIDLIIIITTELF